MVNVRMINDKTSFLIPSFPLNAEKYNGIEYLTSIEPPRALSHRVVLIGSNYVLILILHHYTFLC